MSAAEEFWARVLKRVKFWMLSGEAGSLLNSFSHLADAARAYSTFRSRMRAISATRRSQPDRAKSRLLENKSLCLLSSEPRQLRLHCMCSRLANKNWKGD
jgi:hypothetical protein